MAYSFFLFLFLFLFFSFSFCRGTVYVVECCAMGLLDSREGYECACAYAVVTYKINRPKVIAGGDQVDSTVSVRSNFYLHFVTILFLAQGRQGDVTYQGASDWKIHCSAVIPRGYSRFHQDWKIHCSVVIPRGHSRFHQDLCVVSLDDNKSGSFVDS